MSHHIYTTPGFIIHSSPHGEAGKFFLIFTRDLGMVGAKAQGVRLSKSKLKYHVQDYSYSLFSLVRGKDVWRLTGAKEMEEDDGIKGLEKKRLNVRILLLLKRLMPGEEKNEKLYEVLKSFHSYLALHEDNLELLEYMTVLRILFHLGYIKNVFEDLTSSIDLNSQIFEKVEKSKSAIIKEINNGLKESQL